MKIPTTDYYLFYDFLKSLTNVSKNPILSKQLEIYDGLLNKDDQYFYDDLELMARDLTEFGFPEEELTEKVKNLEKSAMQYPNQDKQYVVWLLNDAENERYLFKTLLFIQQDP